MRKIFEGKKRNYIKFSPGQPKGYPAGNKTFYECKKCGFVVHSIPEHYESCQCGNIVVDSSGGRMSVEDPENMMIFKIN